MDKDKGLFEKIKKTVTANQTAQSAGQSLAAPDDGSFAKQIEQKMHSHHDAVTKQLANAAELARLDLQQKEQLLQQQFVLEKTRLISELEAKYQRSSAEYIQSQEEGLQQKFVAEKQRLEAGLKEKYERISRAALQKREQEIMQHAQQEIAKAKAHEKELITYAKKQHNLNNNAWQLKLDQLQQELEQSKQRFKMELESAMHKARLELESQTKYEHGKILERERDMLAKNLTKEQERAIEQQANSIKRHSAVEMQRNIEQIKADYDVDLNRHLLEKERELHHRFQNELAKNNELQQAKLEQEISKAVAQAIKETEQKLSAEFALQQQQFNRELEQMQNAHERELQNRELELETKNDQLARKDRQQHLRVSELETEIKQLQAEFAANRTQLEQQIEASIRAEYEAQINYYKSEEYQIKEVSRLLVEQKQALARELEAESIIVIKHKQRDLELEHEAKLAAAKQGLQTQFADDLQTATSVKEQELAQQFAAYYADKEQQLIAECDAKLQDARLTVEYATKQQALAAEQIAKLQSNDHELRNDLNHKHVLETKTLLQKQQQILFEQFRQDLQNQLQGLEQKLRLEHENQVRALYLKIEVAENLKSAANSGVQQNIAVALAAKEQEFNLKLLQQKTQLENEFAVNLQRALQAQEAKLRAELAVPIKEFVYAPATMPDDYRLQHALAAQKEQLMAQFALQANALQHGSVEIENRFRAEKEAALAGLRAELEIARAQVSAAPQVDENIEERLATAIGKREQEIRLAFQDKLQQQRKEDSETIRSELNQAMQHEMQQAVEKYKAQVLAEINHQQGLELQTAHDELQEQFLKKLQQNLEVIKAEQEQLRAEFQLEFENTLQEAKGVQKEELQAQFTTQLAQLEQNKQEAIAIRIEQERKKLNLKYAQDKATLIQELSARFTQEKQAEMAAFENHLRDSLYKEMVKQKEYLQTKFTNAQEHALQEQKRRIEAEHKHEIERIKQGYFVKAESNEFTQTIANTRTRANTRQTRNVESLAESILSKFQGHD